MSTQFVARRLCHPAWLHLCFALMLASASPGQGRELNGSTQGKAQVQQQSAEKERKELRERLDFLENEVLTMQEKVGSRSLLHAFDALELDIGGFATQSFAVLDSEKRQEGAFDLGQFELTIKAELDEQWSSFTLLEFRREAKIDESSIDDLRFKPIRNAADLELMYVSYRHDDLLEFRTGRMVTPHGIINVDHFHPVLLHVPYPMFMRQGRAPSLFERFYVGAELRGTLPLDSLGEFRAGYVAYLGSVKAEPGRYAFGARMRVHHEDSGTELGLNFARGRHKEGSGRGSFTLEGVDLEVDQGWLLIQTEAYLSDEDGEQRSA